jgi:NADH dehydrogenase
VQRVDPERQVVVTDGGEYPYDFLIVAAGARHAYFAHPEWEVHAPGLKSVDDAIAIRQRILTAFERAELTEDPVERAALLHFVIVGGGPTGVELAGMIPTVAGGHLSREFHHITSGEVKTTLLEGGPRVLPYYPEELSEHARRDLTELGVEVRTNALVTSVTPTEVHVGGEIIDTRTVIWAAGNAASPLAKSLGADVDRVGRVLVNQDLSIPGHLEIFAVGDMVYVESKGKPVPGVAPAAMQMGPHAVKNIKRTIEGRARLPFVYRNKGDLATIGRHKAIADLGFMQVTGFAAWWFWLFLHIMYLAGFRNRLSVLLEWGYSYFTYDRGARLIHR